MSLPSERIRVHAAPAGLRPRVICAIERDVRASEAQPLRAPVHANPFACLNLVLQGRVHTAQGALPASFVTGPFSQPFETVVQEPLRSVSLVFQPWLLRPWFGLDPALMVDSVTDAAGAESEAAQALLEACRDIASGDPARAWRAIEDRPAGCAEPGLALDVLAEQGVDGAAAALGCSTRHYRRHFHRAMGLGPAAWVRLTRWQSALLGLAGSGGTAARPLAELADAAGYADQAHLTRETGAIACRSPAQLRRALERGEGHWSLQPARVRNLQDTSG